MSKLILIAVVYLLCLLSGFTYKKNILITPSSLFLIGFLVQIFYTFNYVEEYAISISDRTFLVLVLGSLLFVINCSLASKSKYVRKRGKKIISVKTQKSPFEECTQWKLILCICVQIIAIYLSIHHLRTLGTGTISELMYAYRSASFGYNHLYDHISTSLPLIVRTFRRFSYASGFIWAYLLAYTFVYKNERQRLLIIINLILSLICDLLIGGRKGSFHIIFSLGIMIYYLKGNMNGWKKSIKMKTLVVGIIVGIIILNTFSLTAQIVGRQVTKTNADYLAMYLAAPVKNLDLYITKGNSISKAENYLSLPGVASFLRDYLRVVQLNVGHTYPYNRVNGANIGNAYTTYYAFLFDHGILGILIFVPIMAWITEKFFLRAIKSNNQDISLDMIIYAFLAYGVFLSFFDNTYYINLVNIKFVEYCIFWVILKYFLLEKIRLGDRKKSS